MDATLYVFCSVPHSCLLYSLLWEDLISLLCLGLLLHSHCLRQQYLRSFYAQRIQGHRGMGAKMPRQVSFSFLVLATRELFVGWGRSYCDFPPDNPQTGFIYILYRCYVFSSVIHFLIFRKTECYEISAPVYILALSLSVMYGAQGLSVTAMLSKQAVCRIFVADAASAPTLKEFTHWKFLP